MNDPVEVNVKNGTNGSEVNEGSTNLNPKQVPGPSQFEGSSQEKQRKLSKDLPEGEQFELEPKLPPQELPYAKPEFAETNGLGVDEKCTESNPNKIAEHSNCMESSQDNCDKFSDTQSKRKRIRNPRTTSDPFPVMKRIDPEANSFLDADQVAEVTDLPSLETSTKPERQNAEIFKEMFENTEKMIEHLYQTYDQSTLVDMFRLEDTNKEIEEPCKENTGRYSYYLFLECLRELAKTDGDRNEIKLFQREMSSRCCNSGNKPVNNTLILIFWIKTRCYISDSNPNLELESCIRDRSCSLWDKIFSPRKNAQGYEKVSTSDGDHNKESNTFTEGHTSSSNAQNSSVHNGQTSEQNGQPCTSAPNGIQSSNGLQDEDLEGVNSGRQPLERHSEDNAIAKNGSSDSSSDDPNNTSQPHSQELGGDQKNAQPTVAFASGNSKSQELHPERVNNEEPNPSASIAKQSNYVYLPKEKKSAATDSTEKKVYDKLNGNPQPMSQEKFFRYLRQNFRETLQVRCFLINLENSCCFHPIQHFFRYCHEKFFLGIYMEYAAVRRNYTKISCCCGCCGTCLIFLISLLVIIGILIGFINLLWKIVETLGH